MRYIALGRAELEIPAFTKGKEQLSKEELERSRQLARVRILVERVIWQLTSKEMQDSHRHIANYFDRGLLTMNQLLIVFYL
jgi:hypothetical protein